MMGSDLLRSNILIDEFYGLFFERDLKMDMKEMLVCLVIWLIDYGGMFLFVL